MSDTLIDVAANEDADEEELDQQPLAGLLAGRLAVSDLLNLRLLDQDGSLRSRRCGPCPRSLRAGPRSSLLSRSSFIGFYDWNEYSECPTARNFVR